MKEQTTRQKPQLHRPNVVAYGTMAVLTAAPIGLYLLGIHWWGTDRLQHVFLSKGIWPPLALGAIYVGVWLHTADDLLRSYHFDESGLTIYRPYLPQRRVVWSNVQRMRREHDRIILEVSDGGAIVIFIDNVTDASELSGAIVDHTRH
jgi:hypothetical protein